MANGLELARWLAGRPEVRRVLHPGLPKRPGHPLWKRDFKGASGLFGVVLEPQPKAALAAMLDGLKLFGMGYPGAATRASSCRQRQAPALGHPVGGGPLLRFHSGLENLDDLIADLEAGFARSRRGATLEARRSWRVASRSPSGPEARKSCFVIGLKWRRWAAAASTRLSSTGAAARGEEHWFAKLNEAGQGRATLRGQADGLEAPSGNAGAVRVPRAITRGPDDGEPRLAGSRVAGPRTRSRARAPRGWVRRSRRQHQVPQERFGWARFLLHRRPLGPTQRMAATTGWGSSGSGGWPRNWHWRPATGCRPG